MSSHLLSNNPGTTVSNSNANQGRNSGRTYNGSGALNSITQIYGTNSGSSSQNQTAQNANHHHHMLKMIKKSQIDTTNVG